MKLSVNTQYSNVCKYLTSFFFFLVLKRGVFTEPGEKSGGFGDGNGKTQWNDK